MKFTFYLTLAKLGNKLSGILISVTNRVTDITGKLIDKATIEKNKNETPERV